MTIYDVHFHGDTQFAIHQINANDPQHAIRLARALYRDEPLELWFEPYDELTSLEEIVVCDSTGDKVGYWLDDDKRLRSASRDLLQAAQNLVASWQQGDLTEAVRDLSAAIAKATGGAV